MQDAPIAVMPTHEVITFYSYKGGTGRTMALANTACLYANRPSTRVLAIDWDLEAPGLHFYLRATDAAIDATSSPGVAGYFARALELVDDDVPDVEDEDERADAILRELPLSDFCRPSGLRGIDLMPAGRLDATYESQLGALDWRRLFDRAPGIYRAFARSVSSAYDVVLIDSRTGMTDISGICTSLLPDKLVVVFTPNNQSLTGIEKLVQSSVKYRQSSRDIRPLLVYPLASRIDGQRDKLRAAWRQGDSSRNMEGYQLQFERIFKGVYALETCEMAAYFEEVQAPHSPDYSYGEDIAALSTGESDRLSLVRGYEALLRWMDGSAAPWEDPAIVAKLRRLGPLIQEAKSAVESTSSGKRLLIDLQEQMLKILMAQYGAVHGQTVAIVGELIDAHLLSESINLSRAGELLDHLASAVPQLTGIHFWNAIRRLLTGAAVLRAAEHSSKADELIEVARSALAASPSEVESSRLQIVQKMASELFALSYFTEAQMLQQIALDASRRIYGLEHRNTLKAMDALADTLHVRRDYTAAHALQKELLSISERVLGEESPEALVYREKLAGTSLDLDLCWASDRAQELSERGDLAQAMELMSHVAIARREQLGPTHPVTESTEKDLQKIRFALIRKQKLGDYASSFDLAEDPERLPLPSVRDLIESQDGKSGPR